MTLRTGRFGPYVQLGEAEKGGEKPKRSSIPKGWAVDEIDLEAALKLLSLPREVAAHPETGKPITAGIGRYGPFVSHDGKYANLDGVDEVFTVGANRAIALLAEKKSGGRGRNAAAVLKELGEHPTEGGAITVRSGRYGPYVNHGKINATLPRDMKPEEVSAGQAVALLAEKAAKGPAPKKAPAKKKAAAKSRQEEGARQEAGGEEGGCGPQILRRQERRRCPGGNRLSWRATPSASRTHPFPPGRRSSTSSQRHRARSASARSRAPSMSPARRAST